MKKLFVAMLLVPLFALTGCGGGGGGGGSASGDQQQPGPQPAATAVGTLIGEASSAVVGTEGGTVTSADGKVTITVPAGAVSTSTTITIQPVTNHAHGGAGSAYQLLPEGQTFAKPVTLSFNYSDADVAGSAESALGVAFQRSNGTWEWVDPQVDTVANKVTAQTTHFSHWSMVHGFRLFPHQATVGTGMTVALKVTYCYTEPVGDLVALGFACKENDPDLPWLEGYVNDWSVDGVLGGNSTKGTVTGEDFNATFTAPSTVPTPDTVAVSARVRAPHSTEMSLIVANVKIGNSLSVIHLNGTAYPMTLEDQTTNNIVAGIDPCNDGGFTYYQFDPHELKLVFNLGVVGIYSSKTFEIIVPNNPGVGTYSLASSNVYVDYYDKQTPDATFWAAGPDRCIQLDNATEICSSGSVAITERDDANGRLKGSFNFKLVNYDYPLHEPQSVTLDGTFDVQFSPPSACN